MKTPTTTHESDWNDEPVVAELGAAAALNVLDQGDELDRYLADRARSRGAK